VAKDRVEAKAAVKAVVKAEAARTVAKDRVEAKAAVKAVVRVEAVRAEAFRLEPDRIMKQLSEVDPDAARYKKLKGASCRHTNMNANHVVSVSNNARP